MELNEWLVLVLLTLVGIGGLLYASASAGGSQSMFGLVVTSKSTKR